MELQTHNKNILIIFSLSHLAWFQRIASQPILIIKFYMHAGSTQDKLIQADDHLILVCWIHLPEILIVAWKEMHFVF